MIIEKFFPTIVYGKDVQLNNNQLATLTQASKQMETFLVDPQKMMAARGGLAGLHG